MIDLLSVAKKADEESTKRRQKIERAISEIEAIRLVDECKAETPEPLSSEWIDVNDRLPNTEDTVLAWIIEDAKHYGERGCVLARYNKWGRWEWQAFGNYCTGFTKTEITHWQELPTTPEEIETF